MKKEYDLKKLKRGRRGPLASPDAKVLKTLRLDPEVLGWFREQGDKQGIPYQTLMNATLRQAMQSSSRNLSEEIRQIIREELDRKAS
jgi:uncharacterized protein (DUF4415 family)